MPDSERLQRMQTDISDIQTTVQSIDRRLAKGDVRFATMGVELGLVKKIVFGAVGLGLMVFGYAIANAVL